MNIPPLAIHAVSNGETAVAAYMDRVNISFAAPQMNRDLHISNTAYGLGAGLFFLTYAACEVPSNLLLYRMRIGNSDSNA
jgi:sugar phosphate permease